MTVPSQNWEKAINDKVRLYAKVGSALVAGREQGIDAFAAIEAIVSWEVFSESVREAGQLARDENFNPLSLITEHFPQLRDTAQPFWRCPSSGLQPCLGI